MCRGNGYGGRQSYHDSFGSFFSSVILLSLLSAIHKALAIKSLVNKKRQPFEKDCHDKGNLEEIPCEKKMQKTRLEKMTKIGET